MAATDAERAELAGDGRVPVYGTPEEAVRALGHAVRYAAWRREGPDEPPALAGVDADAVSAVLAGALADRRRLARPVRRRDRAGGLRHPAGRVAHGRHAPPRPAAEPPSSAGRWR